MPVLVLVSGSRTGERFEFDREAVIGRGSGCLVRLHDERASRRHAALAARGGRVLLEDLGSRNGTWIGDARVEGPTELRPGDTIRVGRSVLLFEPVVEARAARFTGGVLLLDEGPAPEPASEGAQPPAPTGVGALALRLEAAEDERALATAALQDLASSFGADRGALLIRAPGEEEPWPAALVGTEEMVLGRRLVTDVLRSGRPGLRQEPPRPVEGWGELGERWLLVAPLLQENGPAGLVALETDSADRWTAADAARLHGQAALVGAALEALRSRLELARTLEAAQRGGATGPELVGESVPMRRLLDEAREAGRAAAAVRVAGEPGSGRETLARYVHEHSAVAVGPFVVVSCAGIEPDALREILFGEGPGVGRGGPRAGALEQAYGGSLFLEGWDTVPAELRAEIEGAVGAHLTRAGRPSPLPVRLLAASGPQPTRRSPGGLPWRRLRVPPLRERLDDLPRLFEHFAQRAARSLGRTPTVLSREARRAAETYDWPGNVRELALWVERSSLLKESGAVLAAGDVPHSGGVALRDGGEQTLEQQIAALEASEIARILREEDGVKVRAARRLGISRPTLDRKMAQYGLRMPGR